MCYYEQRENIVLLRRTGAHYALACDCRARDHDRARHHPCRGSCLRYKHKAWQYKQQIKKQELEDTKKIGWKSTETIEAAQTSSRRTFAWLKPGQPF